MLTIIRIKKMGVRVGNIHVGVISNTEQQLTLQLTLSNCQILMSTLVYAKWSAQERLQL